MGVLTGALTLTACSAPPTLEPATAGHTPACATLVGALPTQLGNLGRDATSGAGTASWGDGTITLFCGVPEPAPTADHCLSAGPSEDVQIDWIWIPGSDSDTFVTFGRTPATQVRVPKSAEFTGPEYLIDIASALISLPQYAQCS